jgi:predicted nucleic acid-binding protein
MPRSIVVDTTVLIDASRRRGNVDAWLVGKLSSGKPLPVSAVTVAAFVSGFSPEHEADARALLEPFEIVPVTLEIAARAGHLRHPLARRGRALALADAVIAATAIAGDAIPVTSNVRDFAITALTVRLQGCPATGKPNSALPCGGWLGSDRGKR